MATGVLGARLNVSLGQSFSSWLTHPLFLGKQTVYHALQESSDDASPELLAALGQEIATLQDELSTIKAAERKARTTLAVLETRSRLSTLREEIVQLAAERDELRARVELKRSGEVDDQPQISPEARAQLERDWTQWQRHVIVRRRICREMWEYCSEVLPEDTTAAELWVSLFPPQSTARIVKCFHATCAWECSQGVWH